MKLTKIQKLPFVLILTLISITISNKNPQLSQAQLPPVKNGKDGNASYSLKKHSLFTENDSLQRMSNAYMAVPPPDVQPKTENAIQDPEKQMALRLVEHYKRIFDYLDFKTVDDCLNEEELSIAYQDFDWPTGVTQVSDPVDFAKSIIEQHDAANKNCMDFVDFCKYMEEMWSSADQIQQKDCNTDMDKAMTIWQSLFDWLDRDGDKTITKEDMVYGISKIMYRDVIVEEVLNVFTKYDPNQTKKINFDSFVLAIMNGVLDETLKAYSAK